MWAGQVKNDSALAVALVVWSGALTFGYQPAAAWIGYDDPERAGRALYYVGTHLFLVFMCWALWTRSHRRLPVLAALVGCASLAGLAAVCRLALGIGRPVPASCAQCGLCDIALRGPVTVVVALAFLLVVLIVQECVHGPWRQAGRHRGGPTHE